MRAKPKVSQDARKIPKVRLPSSLRPYSSKIPSKDNLKILLISHFSQSFDCSLFGICPTIRPVSDNNALKTREDIHIDCSTQVPDSASLSLFHPNGFDSTAWSIRQVTHNGFSHDVVLEIDHEESIVKESNLRAELSETVSISLLISLVSVPLTDMSLEDL